MTMTVELLQAFADAWNRHDIEALMDFMTDDCVFEASAGSQVCGTSWVGRNEVRRGFEEVWATYPDARWNSPRHFVCGDGIGFEIDCVEPKPFELRCLYASTNRVETK